MRMVLATIAASTLLMGSALACSAAKVTAESKRPLVTTSTDGPVSTPVVPAKPKA